MKAEKHHKWAKTHFLRVNVTPEQKLQIERAIDGKESVSSWVRRLIEKELKRDSEAAD